MKKIPLLIFFLFLSFATFAQQLSPIGTWLNESGEARIEIYKCNGEKLCGKIVWLKEPDRDGKPKTDLNNPDEKLRSRPIKGMVLMKNFEHDEKNEWEDGEIYDPKNGKTYSCNLTMINQDKLEVRGYIGFSMIGRTQTWTRVK